VTASPLLALLLLAAPQLDIPTGAPIQLDGVVKPEEWADATEIKSGKHFIRLKRQGRWLAVAFGGEQRYADEILRLHVSDEVGAWQTVLLLTGGVPSLPPALWGRAHPAVIHRMLGDSRAPLLAPRGVLVRMNVGGNDSWSGEYLVRLGALGIGQGDRRRFRCRLVFVSRSAAGEPAIVYPEGTTHRDPPSKLASLTSAENWGAAERWPPVSTQDSVQFDDHHLLWRLAVEHDRFKVEAGEGQLVIAQAVRPLSRAKVGDLRRRIEAGQKRNPTLPAWTHFLGRLLHESNQYDAAAKVIDTIPAALRRLDPFALLAAEHFLDTEDWETALRIATAYQNALGMRELAVAANTVRLMVQAEAAVEKNVVELGEERPLVHITTRGGTIELELFEDSAPHAVHNFVDLVSKKFYDGQRFGPVIGGTIARSGDPRSREAAQDGPDGPPWKVKADRSERQPLLGRLIAIPAAEGVNHGSQFGILLAPLVQNRESVTVFGRVTKGMDVLLGLEDGDRITKLEVVRRRNHSYDALASRVK